MPSPVPEPASLPSAPAAAVWQLRLLGAVEARRDGVEITRWPSRAAVVLLARLALAPQRAHAREELVELLWPGVALDVGRNRLRQVLSTLKSLLEPADGADGAAAADAGAVISADRSTIRLLPGRLTCDAVEFERLVRSGALAAARECYRGELMPSFYDEWVLEARTHLAGQFERIESLAPAAPAAALPTPAQANPLPGSWTRLFGVEHSATRLVGLVRHERLVTVTGAGGAGKTRLAIEAARALRDTPDWSIEGHGGGGVRFARIVFVSLVDCLDEHQAVDTLARALNVAARDPLQNIQTTLAGQTALLVLDNFEQLADSACGMLVTLLEGLPDLHLLVTSRQHLGLPGEQAFALGGLPLPESDARPAVAAMNPAVALFVDRARAARADFQPAAHDWPALCALVRLLDGMPLALELAASRVRSTAPGELLQRLQASAGTPLLDVLERSPGAAPSAQGRHASLRAVMSWSWRQLKAPQAALLQAMTVLAAPARFEAVAAAAGTDAQLTRSVLQDLIDASLVQARDDPGNGAGVTRHSLLQPVREFAAEGLAPADVAAARARLRHWLIERAPLLLAAGARAFEAELAHVFAGITSAVADAVPIDAARIAVALKRYWTVDTLESMPVGVMQALDRAAAAELEPALRSELCELLAHARCLSGFMPEGLQHARQALASACNAQQHSLARSRLAWAHVLAGQHSVQDDALIDEAVVLGHTAGDVVAEAIALRLRAMVMINVHCDFAGAEADALRAQTLWEQLGDPRNARRRLLDRATCWAWAGRNEDAALALGHLRTRGLARR